MLRILLVKDLGWSPNVEGVKQHLDFVLVLQSFFTN